MDRDRKKNLARTMNRLGKSSHIMVEILTWLDPKDLLQMNVVNAAFYEKHVPLTMRILRLKLPSMLTMGAKTGRKASVSHPLTQSLLSHQ